VVKLGLREESFQQILHHNLNSLIAQYYGMVQDGLLNAMHAFKGLKRPLMLGDDMQADQGVVVYSWRPQFDFFWSGSRFEGEPIRKTPPPGRVFVVLTREEAQPNEFSVFGSIERWNWIKEDPNLPHAPVEWSERYGTHLWSINQ